MTPLNILVTPELDAAVTKLAKQQGRNRADIIRLAFTLYKAAWEREVQVTFPTNKVGGV